MFYLTKDIKRINPYRDDYKQFEDYDETKFYAIFCICTATYFVLDIRGDYYDFRELDQRCHWWFYHSEYRHKTAKDALIHILTHASQQSLMEFDNKEEFIEYIKEQDKRYDYEKNYSECLNYL